MVPAADVADLTSGIALSTLGTPPQSPARNTISISFCSGKHTMSHKFKGRNALPRMAILNMLMSLLYMFFYTILYISEKFIYVTYSTPVGRF